MLAARANHFRERWMNRRSPAADSVRLTQRRIFIIPSRVGLGFCLSLLLMLLAAVNYQNSLAYALTFLQGSVFLVSILHTFRNLAGLSLRAGTVPAVFAGEQASFRVHLTSEGQAHQAVALGWTNGPLQTLDVPAEGACEAVLTLPTERRGWLRAPRMRVESRFPLGLLVAWSWVDLQQRALVYPRPLRGELPWSAGRAMDSEEQRQRLQNLGADDYQGLRTYQPGDSRRRLHWKAYSRGQGLLVKDFAAFGGGELLLDFDGLEGDQESRLSLLCHWVLQLSSSQQRFALRLPDRVLGPGSGEAHRSACLQALALFREGE